MKKQVLQCNDIFVADEVLQNLDLAQQPLRVNLLSSQSRTVTANAFVGSEWRGALWIGARVERTTSSTAFFTFLIATFLLMRLSFAALHR